MRKKLVLLKGYLYDGSSPIIQSEQETRKDAPLKQKRKYLLKTNILAFCTGDNRNGFFELV